VKFVVVVKELSCLFGPKVTPLDTEKDVMTVCEGVEEEVLVEGVEDLRKVRIRRRRLKTSYLSKHEGKDEKKSEDGCEHHRRRW
jgi:hypothetical protein